MHRNLRRDPTPGGSPVVRRSPESKVQSPKSRRRHQRRLSVVVAAGRRRITRPSEVARACIGSRQRKPASNRFWSAAGSAAPRRFAQRPPAIRSRETAETRRRREGIESGKHENRPRNEGESLKEKGEIGTPHPASFGPHLPAANSQLLRTSPSSILHPASFRSPSCHLPSPISSAPAPKNTHGVERLRIPPRLYLPGRPPVIDSVISGDPP